MNIIVIKYLLIICFLFSSISKLFSFDAFEKEVIQYGTAYIGEWIANYSYTFPKQSTCTE